MNVTIKRKRTNVQLKIDARCMANATYMLSMELFSKVYTALVSQVYNIAVFVDVWAKLSEVRSGIGCPSN